MLDGRKPCSSMMKTRPVRGFGTTHDIVFCGATDQYLVYLGEAYTRGVDLKLLTKTRAAVI